MSNFRHVLIAMLLAMTSVAAAADEPPRIALQPLVRGLERPVDLTHDGTSRLFVVEQPGRIRIIEDGKLLPRPFLDISKKVESQGECGLLGLRFHPNFAKNGYFYVDYTSRQGNLKTFISEFRCTKPDATEVDPRTERVILTIDQPYPNHNGGQLQFGPDGFLYIAMGDGGAAGDPQNRAQNPQELLGKILRIDIDQRKPYGIPKDNPFVQRKNFRPEIWAWGLRNPWRFSFDPETGTCYAGDVGQNAFEEIDIIVKGGNYGWRIREGLHPFREKEAQQVKLIDPIKEYGRNLGVSVTGGCVYRGKEIPELQGWYLYADFASGRIWGLKYEDGELKGDAELLKMRGQPSSFGVDIDGEMYVCDHGPGVVHRIVGEK